MLKVNIFTYVFWPEQFLVNELAKELSEKNIEVNILTGLPNYPRGEFFDGYSVKAGPYAEQHEKIKIRRYPIFPRKKGFARLMLNYLSHLVSASVTQFYLPKAEWSLVFATSPITTAIPAIIWARLTQSKVCIWLQDLWPDSVAAVGATNRNSLLTQFLGFVVSWIYKRTDLMLIQSPAFADNLKEYGYKGPTVLIPNWAPDLNFENALTPDWLKELPQKFTVTFAGNVGKAQAIDTIMEAAKIVSDRNDIQFVIVGDGSELERIKKLSVDNSLNNIFFLGRRPLDDMAGLFNQSDVLLVSLKKDPIFAQTIPSKVQAYMAAGKPIIGSLDGVGSQIIQDAQCGFSAPAEDSKGLSRAILQIADLNPEKRLELGANAKRYYYENFQKDRIIGQIISYLERYK